VYSEKTYRPAWFSFPKKLMRELDLVRRIGKMAGISNNPHIVTGIGDDCAVLRPPPNSDLVFTTDFVIEDRHFRIETHSPADVGHKALARSLSDLAAMGSTPLFCLVSLAIPAALTGNWVDQFYEGLLALAQTFGVTLAGGDLSSSEKVIADVMCCGYVPRGRAILRTGAKPADRICVTGKLGAASHSDWLVRATPRIVEGQALNGIVSAGMDISDGLSIDLLRLCEASNTGAQLRSAAIPIAPGASLEQALHGGEDYELLVTVPPGFNLPVCLTEIGVITAEPAGRVLLDGDPLAIEGFEHFSK
jgi:thiamine-monophosphate kinase